jgi:hypothetical protein
MVKKMQESVVTRKESDASPSILVQEYNSLVNLYTHAENTLFSIFNFYVTLLTTITGAIVVVFQLSEKNTNNPFGAILVLLVFIVLIGIITQDALIHKNGDLAHFALAINSIKTYLLKNHPKAKPYVFYMWDLHVRVNPLKYKVTLDERIDKYLWWMLPIGMQQLFVSLMNSFALGLLVIMFVAVYGNLQQNVLKLFLIIPFVIILGYVAQCTYANMKFRQKIRRSAIATNGQVHEWIGL